MNNYDLLKSIFVEMFDVDESSDFSNLSQETLKNWDSMMQVNLIVAIESELGISIDSEDYEMFTSFENILKVIQKNN